MALCGLLHAADTQHDHDGRADPTERLDSQHHAGVAALKCHQGRMQAGYGRWHLGETDGWSCQRQRYQDPFLIIADIHDALSGLKAPPQTIAVWPLVLQGRNQSAVSSVDDALGGVDRVGHVVNRNERRAVR